MGVGFIVIRENHAVSGIVDRVNDHVATDGDWCFSVRPDFASDLINHRGYRNSSGTTEYEVEPAAAVYGSAGHDEVFRGYVNRLQGQRVEMVGTYVADCAHTVHGDDCHTYWTMPWWSSTECCNHGKTEIHPIASILAYSPTFGHTHVNRLELTFRCLRHASLCRLGELRCNTWSAADTGKPSPQMLRCEV